MSTAVIFITYKYLYMLEKEQKRNERGTGK